MGAIKSKKHTRDARNHVSKLKKDPGVPDLARFKRKQEEKDKEKKKRQEAQAQRRQGAPASLTLSQLVQAAEQRGEAFSSKIPQDDENDTPRTLQDAATAGQKDNSRKAYYREFRKVLERADVVLEILDARDPLGTRTRSVERMILDSGLNKKIILVLNKIDLVPKENIEVWLKHLRNEYPTIAFKSSTQKQRTHLGQSTVSPSLATDGLLQSSECLGADSLVRLLKNYCRNVNIKTSITVGIIGYPNVGKSSVINSLKRAKVCGVGSTPGFTKSAQQVTLDKNIKLLDCPGIVFAQQGQDGQTDAEIALRNCIKVELLDDPVAPVEVIMTRFGREQLMQMYQVGFFNNAHEFLVLLAQQRGKLKKGGVADIHLAARHVLQDWNNGKIPFYSTPPVSQQQKNTTIVAGWSEALNVDLLDADRLVLSGLKSSAEFDPHAVIMASEMQVDTDNASVAMEMQTE